MKWKSLGERGAFAFILGKHSLGEQGEQSSAFDSSSSIYIVDWNGALPCKRLGGDVWMAMFG